MLRNYAAFDWRFEKAKAENRPGETCADQGCDHDSGWLGKMRMRR